MACKILKWGNSVGVRIPKVYMDKLGLKTGDSVDFNTDGEKLIVTKVSENTLKSRIEKFNGEGECEKFEWSESRGKEIW